MVLAGKAGHNQPGAARALLPRLDSLTGLRFFAAYFVLQHHFTNFAELPILSRYNGFGATGVSFFFVLSGFVIMIHQTLERISSESE